MPCIWIVNSAEQGQVQTRKRKPGNNVSRLSLSSRHYGEKIENLIPY